MPELNEQCCKVSLYNNCSYDNLHCYYIIVWGHTETNREPQRFRYTELQMCLYESYYIRDWWQKFATGPKIDHWQRIHSLCPFQKIPKSCPRGLCIYIFLAAVWTKKQKKTIDQWHFCYRDRDSNPGPIGLGDLLTVHPARTVKNVAERSEAPCRGDLKLP